jgi:hypothetical protein
MRRATNSGKQGGPAAAGEGTSTALPLLQDTASLGAVRCCG